MIRAFVAGIGALLLVASVILFIVMPIAWPGALELDVFGLLILGSLAFERHYRGNRHAHGWQPTGERFVDPTTGKLTEVRYNPSTGERAYIAESTTSVSLPADSHREP